MTRCSGCREVPWKRATRTFIGAVCPQPWWAMPRSHLRDVITITCLRHEQCLGQHLARQCHLDGFPHIYQIHRITSNSPVRILHLYGHASSVSYLEIWKWGVYILGVHLQKCSNFSIFRPPGTTVPDGLIFCPRCFFCFATRSPSSLDRSPWNFITWSESDWIL